MKNKEIVVILDNIRSRENVGSIFRTADAAGVSRVYLCGIAPCPPHEKISKSSLGADLMVPWEYHKQTWRLLESLKKEGYKIVALENTSSAKGLFDTKGTTGRTALILGNEVSGITRQILDRCNLVLSIPMYGAKESLNVSVAFGIAVYQLRKS